VLDAHPEQWLTHRCINISSVTSAPPYIRVKGRATDFVPQAEGLKLLLLTTLLQASGQAPAKEAKEAETASQAAHGTGSRE